MSNLWIRTKGVFLQPKFECKRVPKSVFGVLNSIAARYFVGLFLGGHKVLRWCPSRPHPGGPSQRVFDELRQGSRRAPRELLESSQRAVGERPESSGCCRFANLCFTRFAGRLFHALEQRSDGTLGTIHLQMRGKRKKWASQYWIRTMELMSLQPSGVSNCTTSNSQTCPVSKCHVS